MRTDPTRRHLLATLAYGARGMGGDTALEVQVLQTASSLEALAVSGYEVALAALRGPAGIAEPKAGDTVTTFLGEAQRKHFNHKRAFQAQTRALDPNAEVQNAPNPKFRPLQSSADLSTPGKVLELATVLEKVVIDTYVGNLTVVQDPATKALLGRAMAVGAQHLAGLRMLSALLAAGATELVAVPFPLTSLEDLPQAAVLAAFPDALHVLNGADLIAEPASGAIG